MTFEEIVNSIDSDVKEEAMWGELNALRSTLPTYTVELMDSGRGMDEGSNLYAVYKFTDTNGEFIYILFRGFYQSHYGADYEGCKEVFPEQRTITVYS